VIDTVRGGGVIFSYYPDPAWLKSSKFLNCRTQQGPAYTVATHYIRHRRAGPLDPPQRKADELIESRSAASRSSAFATRAISISASAYSFCSIASRTPGIVFTA